MDNRHDLVVDSQVTLADGCGERDAVQQMVTALGRAHPKTIGADKGYDTNWFVQFMLLLRVTSQCYAKQKTVIDREDPPSRLRTTSSSPSGE